MNANSSYKPGFTVLELLIVIAILTILIATGGFFYSDLQKHSEARQGKEFARNFGHLLNNAYRTGYYFSSGKLSLNDSAGGGVPQGTYPRPKDLAATRLLGLYYPEMFKPDKTTESAPSGPLADYYKIGRWRFFGLCNSYGINELPTRNPRKLFCHDELGTTDREAEEFLEKHIGEVVYQPISETNRGAGRDHRELCDGGECRTVYLYYIGLKNGRAAVIPAVKLNRGTITYYDE